MTPLNFIFIGRSGSGKGTQAKLLEKYLKESRPEFPVFYMETGENFRSFLKDDTFASRLSREIYEKGELQPEFLAVFMWSNEFINNLTGKEHLILDGSPRKLREALVLDSALKFFKREKPFVVHIDVSNGWAKERLNGRGRMDDMDENDIKKRLSWFDTEVVPAILWFKESPDYELVGIDGEQTIEKVHQEIIEKVFGI